MGHVGTWRNVASLQGFEDTGRLVKQPLLEVQVKGEVK